MGSGWLAMAAAWAVAAVACSGLTRAQGPGPAPPRALVLGDDRLGTRTAPILLLSRPDVQADLKMETIQVLAAERAILDLHARAAALRGRPNTAEVVSARQAIDEAQRHWLSTTLNPQQQARLLQLDLQWEGPTALMSRPALAESIGLDASQRQTIAAARPGPPPDPANVAAHREADRKLAEVALSVMRPEQRDRWRAMLGPALPFRLLDTTGAAAATATTAKVAAPVDRQALPASSRPE
jgi:hypothetical protein